MPNFISKTHTHQALSALEECKPWHYVICQSKYPLIVHPYLRFYTDSFCFRNRRQNTSNTYINVIVNQMWLERSIGSFIDLIQLLKLSYFHRHAPNLYIDFCLSCVKFACVSNQILHALSHLFSL